MAQPLSSGWCRKKGPSLCGNCPGDDRAQMPATLGPGQAPHPPPPLADRSTVFLSSTETSLCSWPKLLPGACLRETAAEMQQLCSGKSSHQTPQL